MGNSEVIVGLGGLLSGAGCCILKNGRLVAAVEQSKAGKHERYAPFPEEAIRLGLIAAGIAPAEIGCLAIARPFSQGSESETLLAYRSRFPKAEIVVVDHHAGHAASAYYASGYDKAAVLSVDRAGDYRSAVLYEANKLSLSTKRELYFPDSIGDVFNRVAELLGYSPRSDEHKVQWLSTTAEPVYGDAFWDLLHSGGGTWPQLDRRSLSDEVQGGFSRSFLKRLGIEEAGEITQENQAQIAASVQEAVSRTIAGMIGDAEAVCLAGGVGLNALLIASLEAKYGRVFVQPAAGNAGTSIGAALHAWHVFYGEQRRVPFTTLCLGPEYSTEETKRTLENCKLRFRMLLTEGEVIHQAITALADNKIVAWMQGRMEFGPRALGNRSILASPLNPYSTENLNVYIKHREPYRKFAASVPVELAHEYFEPGQNARFLATVSKVKAQHRKTFEAALLGGELIRLHTVDSEENPLYHALLIETGKRTGLPVVYNTSFNLFGAPLVCTPRDAVRSFYSSGVDTLVVGNFVLEK